MTILRRGAAHTLAVAGLVVVVGCGPDTVDPQPPAAGAGAADTGQTADDTASSTPARAKTAGSRIPLPPIRSSSARLADVTPDAVAAPTRLRVPAIGIDAPVAGVGADAQTGEMAVPQAAATVAWYRHGPAPGGRGSAVLAAHVDYDGRAGAFFSLREVPIGAAVSVTLDDGSGWTGVVEEVRSYPKRNLPVSAMFARTGRPVLRLITCGGPFDRAARSYRDNVVVSVAAKD